VSARAWVEYVQADLVADVPGSTPSFRVYLVIRDDAGGEYRHEVTNVEDVTIRHTLGLRPRLTLTLVNVVVGGIARASIDTGSQTAETLLAEIAANSLVGNRE